MRRLTIILSASGTLACGPVDPTPPPIDLQPSSYILILSGTGCSPAGVVPSAGTLIALSQEGSEWIGRSVSANDGSIDLRFHAVVDRKVAGAAAAGTLVGAGLDRRPFAAAGSGVLVSGDSGGRASVSAETTPTVPNVLSGRITGHLLFTGSDVAGPYSCPEGAIVLRPPVACELTAGAACP